MQTRILVVQRNTKIIWKRLNRLWHMLGQQIKMNKEFKKTQPYFEEKRKRIDNYML